jgi:IS30 family transposase
MKKLRKLRKTYKQINKSERIVIEALLKAKKSKREIARVLNRPSGSICYEIKRNSRKGVYVAEKADFKKYQTRHRAKEQCLKVGLDGKLAGIVEGKLKLKWSPDQISGFLKLEGILCSEKAIYKYVRSRCLEASLMFKGKERKAKWKHVKAKQDKEKKSIDIRPRTLGIGHYEADFIVSKHNKYSLLVMVDRVSKYTEIRLIENRKHLTVFNSLKEILKDKPLKSITLDNDISFSNWKYLEQEFKTQIYFTNPYCSWEKGLVENTSRWIRLFAPKKSDLSLLTKENLKQAHDFLNKKPRKVLGYFSAESVYYGQTECID